MDPDRHIRKRTGCHVVYSMTHIFAVLGKAEYLPYAMCKPLTYLFMGALPQLRPPPDSCSMPSMYVGVYVWMYPYYVSVHVWLNYECLCERAGVHIDLGKYTDLASMRRVNTWDAALLQAPKESATEPQHGAPSVCQGPCCIRLNLAARMWTLTMFDIYDQSACSSGGNEK